MSIFSFKTRRALAVMAFAACLAGLGLWSAAGRTSAQKATAKGPPNIVVILSDDQELSTLTRRYMPNTRELLAEPGSELTNFIITTPLCCPSRATLLTGQYGHNNGVLSNKPGYPSLRSKRNVLPAWLQQAGYTTAHAGKYLNGYGNNDAVAPGWDLWYTTHQQRYYNYELSNNGQSAFQGRRSGDYATDVFTKRAVIWIRNLLSGANEKPFFLMLDHLAPHSDGSTSGRCNHSAFPARRDARRYRRFKLPKPPNYDEGNVRDKPSFIRELPRINKRDRRQIRRRYLCRIRSLRAVDRSVQKVVGALEGTGELDNTVVIYYSDNGFFSGEHRLQKSKGLAYEESIKVPGLVRLPDAYLDGESPPTTIDAPLTNVDLAATLLDLAGGEPCITDTKCRVLDGRSFVGLLDNSGESFPADRAIEIEIAQDGQLAGGTRACRYQAIRSGDQVLIEHQRTLDPQTNQCEDSDEIEHYDLTDDPFQLRNRYPGAAGSKREVEQTQLRARLDGLRDCAGIEGRDPTPPNGHYCE